MKYDDASWHYGGNFPAGLPESAGATHIAMFMAWAVLSGLAGTLHARDFVDDFSRLKARTVTPTTWFLAVCDGKFIEDDLNDEGNRFAQSYYGTAEGLHAEESSYLADFSSAFPDSETPYHVPDSWTTFDRLEPIIRSRYEAWRNGR